MEGKSSPQNAEIRPFLTMTCQLIRACNATEIYQNFQNFRTFEKNRCFFFRKKLESFKIAEVGQFDVENLSNDDIPQTCLLHLICEVCFGGNLENFQN